jgi:hypothetical protein
VPVFPSTEWFDAVRARINDDPDYAHIGTCDAVVGIHVPDLGKCYLLTFEVFECTAVTEASREKLRSADFWLEMNYASWREMLENIRQTRGHPDHRHTLNSINYLLDEPFARGDDGLRLDLFYRFNQSFQHFFNRSAEIETSFVETGPVASERRTYNPHN